MIVLGNEKKSEDREAMRGGNGVVTLVHHAQNVDVAHCRLLADLTLPVGASIGEHIHKKETEFYLIREGEGIVIEKEGKKKVGAGDVVITGDGESHSIQNTGNIPLVLTAIIISEV